MRRLDVYIIGTSHQFQVPKPDTPPRQVDAFRRLLQDAVRTHGIHVIAEEMNLEKLSNMRAGVTTCKEIADIIILAHCYCEPDKKTQDVLGIITIDQSVYASNRFFQNIPNEQIDAELRVSDEKREKEWLKKLRELNLTPVLFICGSNHVQRFADLVRHNGFSAFVLHRDWPGH
jgi:hypothetical protein